MSSTSGKAEKTAADDGWAPVPTPWVVLAADVQRALREQFQPQGLTDEAAFTLDRHGIAVPMDRVPDTPDKVVEMLAGAVQNCCKARRITMLCDLSVEPMRWLAADADDDAVAKRTGLVLMLRAPAAAAN